MTASARDDLWFDFLGAWPPERVRQMTLEEYTNPNKDDAFIYWIESRLDTLGSIWGGSAFKFGIYCRDKTATKEAAGGRVWGEKYAWLSKFGATEQEAFATVRSFLVGAFAVGRELPQFVDRVTIARRASFGEPDRASAPAAGGRA